MDQENSFRRAIEGDDIVLGARASTFLPAVVEVYGELGLDFVWLDFEHMGPSPYDSTVFEDLTRAAEVSGTELFVRLPSGDPALIRKVLDAGVRNILVPRVDTVEEVRRAVKATRFVYDGEAGERGKASGRSSSWGNAANYVPVEDEEVCLGVMIEKVTAVKDLEEILDVPELGFIFIGPSDLSVQLGHPTNKNHPDVTELVEEIRATSIEKGVPVGGIANEPDDIVEAIQQGYQILRIGGDLSSVQQTLGRRLDQLDERL